MIVHQQRPALNIIAECWAQNAFGAGVAWRDHERVRWLKGQFTNAEDVFTFTKTLPKPYIIHFRIPTVGHSCDELCHPFPLDGTLALEGATRDGVIAHNGHWPQWRQTLAQFLPVARLPRGPWSDSRAMAWITGQSGEGFLSLLDDAQKIVLFTPSRLERFGSWFAHDGIWFSNQWWANPPGFPLLLTDPRLTLTDDDLDVWDDLQAAFWDMVPPRLRPVHLRDGDT